MVEQNEASIEGEIPSVDPGRLDEIHEVLGDEAESVLLQLVEVFEKESARRLEVLRAGGSLEVLRSAAHGLKSTSSNLGFQRVFELSRGLERAFQSGDLDAVARDLEELSEARDQALEGFRSLVRARFSGERQ